MSLLYRIANFPQYWGDKYNLFTILALFILILAANAIVIQEYVRDPNFDQIPENMYTGLKAILGIVVALALIVVYRMGRQFVYSSTTRSKAWNIMKVLLFLGLIVWAVIPELILLYSRPGCDALELEKAVYINAIVGITVSSLVILWVIASFFVKNPDAGRLQAIAECQKAVNDGFIPFYNGVVQDDNGTYYCFLSDPTVTQEASLFRDNKYYKGTGEASLFRDNKYYKGTYNAKTKKVSDVKECQTQTKGQLCGNPLNEAEARALEAKNKEMCNRDTIKPKLYSRFSIDPSGYVYSEENSKKYCIGKTTNLYYDLDTETYYEMGEVGLKPLAPDAVPAEGKRKQKYRGESEKLEFDVKKEAKKLEPQFPTPEQLKEEEREKLDYMKILESMVGGVYKN